MYGESDHTNGDAAIDQLITTPSYMFLISLAERAAAVADRVVRSACGRAKQMNVGAAVRERRAKLLLLAPDAGANARDRAESFSAGHRVPLVELPFTKDALSAALGKANTVMAAVTDAGFAKALEKCLDGNDAAARQPRSGKTTGNERSDA